MSYPYETGAVSGERLNFILAFCAILVSLASFYATYLQADSAERQVKAMTLPLIQFAHGNYDDSKQLQEISLELKNAGVGPAIINHVSFNYQGKSYANFSDFLKACCAAGVAAFVAQRDAGTAATDDIGGWVSQPIDGIILPGQSEYQFQQITYGDETADLWNQLNKERWNLALKICYCSMLDECFVTEKNGMNNEVASCLAPSE